MIKAIPVGSRSRVVNTAGWVLMAIAAVSAVVVLWLQVP